MLFHYWFFHFYLDEEVVFVEQFGFRVSDFSSQYGSSAGVSYTANNILGPPTRFPAYGDFSETFLPVFIIYFICTFISLTIFFKYQPKK
jgi:hypothetical protein